MLSFDVIGDIAIVKGFLSSDGDKSKYIDIINSNKHIRTVLCQKNGIDGEFRLSKLEWVLGDRRTNTTHQEYGCRFYVDLKYVYYSPRLSFERMRISQDIDPQEVILNMFGGVGSFSILIARYARTSKIYSIDINPKAVQYTLKNINLNKIRNKIVAIFGEAKLITQTFFNQKVDRVLMPLPSKSFEYLPVAVKALKKGKGFIHYYDFVHSIKSEDPVKKIIDKVSTRMRELKINFRIKFGKIVRSVGPNWYQVVLDIEIA